MSGSRRTSFALMVVTVMGAACGPKGERRAGPSVASEPDAAAPPEDTPVVVARDAGTTSEPDAAAPPTQEKEKTPAPDAATAAPDAAVTMRPVDAGAALDERRASPDAAPVMSAVDARPVSRGALVGYWPLDEAQGETAADMSGSGNDGMHINAPAISTMVAPVAFADSHSLAFTQASNQAVTVADSASLSLSGPFTLAAWVRPTIDSTTQQGVIEKWDYDTAAKSGYFLRLSASEKARAAIFDATGAAVEVASTTTIPLGQWTHLAAVFDGASLRIHVNGTQEALSPTTVAPGDGANPLEIGRAEGQNRFNGNIDDVRIYSRALTPAEVQDLARGK